jgi:alpha-beta hydrolase superfamily lysophospholipase
MPARSRLAAAFILALAAVALPVQAQKAISSRNAVVDGASLHYLTAGKGPAVILLHGYAQTSRMWRPLIPRLTERFTVIAPDLPGILDDR